MSIFGKIRDTIFGKKVDAPAAGTSAAAPSAPPGQTAPAATAAQAAPAAPATPAATPASAATQTSAVDVEAVLSGLAEKSGQKLNWRSSIVDLMKLLGMESSLAERRELAKELGYQGDTGDTASMNIWLHKQVMKKLAENGGKVPADLLD